jgi:NADH-quinone oxidoreductase subunit G
LLPAHSIFGSDELSGRSAAISARGPAAFVVLSPADAEGLGVTAGMGVRCAELGGSFGVRVDPCLAPGWAAVSVGLGGVGDEVPADPVQLAPDPDYVAPPADPNAGAQVIARG